MGAGHSSPQTAHILNPARTVTAIEVTPNVISRLESIKETVVEGSLPKPVAPEDNHCKNCCTCGFMKSKNSNLLQLKSKELQESQYHKTMEKLESMLGKPINWADHCEADLKELRELLIKCHSENPREPLRCSEPAKEFQNFVFKEQFKAILKAKNIEDDEQQ